MSDDKNLLSRWSQRKLAVRRGEALDDRPADSADISLVDPLADPLADRLADPLADVGADALSPGDAPPSEPEAPVLPSIETLDAQSDYTVFMAKNVPEMVKRAALRKLWTSDPVLANLDGLNNYDEDYNVIDKAITLAQTSYRPGLGYLDEVKEKLDEVEDKLDRIGDALGAPDKEPVKENVESAAEAEPGGERPDHGRSKELLSDNAAPVDDGSDASRQVVAVGPEMVPDDSAEESGK